MNFFEAQENARKSSRYLTLLFCLSIIVIIALFFFLVSIPLFIIRIVYIDPFCSYFSVWTSSVLIFVAALVLIVILGNTICRIVELRKGGSAVAKMLGAKFVSKATDNPAQKRALNVVEEMAIASGLPIPDLHVLSSDSINAFTAGHTYNNAVIGVTRGSMEKLSRDELQAIIAHEFAHIKNGDMRLNIQTMALIFGLMSTYITGKRIVSFCTQYGHPLLTVPFSVFGILFIIFGYVGVIFGQIIQAAISRQNEYAADAIAVQCTRNPYAFANALRKIGGMDSMPVNSLHTLEVSHLFFSSIFESIFDSHPPLEKRITAIDPHWDGSFLEAESQCIFQEYREEEKRKHIEQNRIKKQKSIEEAKELVFSKKITLGDISIVNQFLNTIPSHLKQAANFPNSAEEMIYAFLLSKNENFREKQIEVLLRYENQNRINYILNTWRYLRYMDNKLSLILLEFCTTTLKNNFTRKSFSIFQKKLREIALSNNEISRKEFILLSLIEEKIGRHFRDNSIFLRYEKFRMMKNSTSVFLSYVADLSQVSKHETRELFSRWNSINGFPQITYQYVNPNDWQRVEQSLVHLRKLAPLELELLINCVAEIVWHDGKIDSEEEETLRILCLTLNCPMPPVN